MISSSCGSGSCSGGCSCSCCSCSGSGSGSGLGSPLSSIGGSGVGSDCGLAVCPGLIHAGPIGVDHRADSFLSLLTLPVVRVATRTADTLMLVQANIVRLNWPGMLWARTKDESAVWRIEARAADPHVARVALGTPAHAASSSIGMALRRGDGTTAIRTERHGYRASRVLPCGNGSASLCIVGALFLVADAGSEAAPGIATFRSGSHHAN